MNDGFVVDSNLLVLLAVGLTSVDIVAKHKKTKSFTAKDYFVLAKLIEKSPIVILPNIATEVSNLLAYHGEPERSRVLSTFRTLADATEETVVSTRTATADREFLRLGVTDCAILKAAAGRTILTSDLDLYASALRRGLAAINFYHVREGAEPGL